MKMDICPLSHTQSVTTKTQSYFHSSRITRTRDKLVRPSVYRQYLCQLKFQRYTPIGVQSTLDNLSVIKGMASSNKQLRSWMGSMSTVAGVTSKNLAQRFTPHQPMQSAGITPERVKAWLDIPKQLKETVDSGKISIGTTCLKENAELIIGLYEDMCLQHIIGMQIQDKTLGKIIRGNQAIELANPSDHGLQEPGKRIARSSLLGQDPWGDEKVPDDPEQIAGVTTYTRMQTLLKRIQDDNYLYLTTHVKRLLHKDIYLNVKNEEVRYELNTNNVRTNSKRDRMPWKRYKDVVFELLPVQIGLHELRILMTLNREDRESAQSWVQSLTEGKRLLEEKNI